MKHTIYFLFVLISQTALAQLAKVEIQATGLTCSMCSNAINKQLKSLTDIASVATDLNTNTFVVQLKPNNNLSPRTFKESVEKAGFFIGTMVVQLNSSVLNATSNRYIALEDKTAVKNQEIRIQILNKGYVTQKEYKKLEKNTLKLPPTRTMMMASFTIN